MKARPEVPPDKQLTQWAEDALAEWELLHGDRGCTCFTSPPCPSCTHPGNPSNLESTDDAWEQELHG